MRGESRVAWIRAKPIAVAIASAGLTYSTDYSSDKLSAAARGSDR